MFALVDCNNFYASCERLFRPDLVGKPIVVLSNNDGCVIARSQEAKDLGIEGRSRMSKEKPLRAVNRRTGRSGAPGSPNAAAANVPTATPANSPNGVARPAMRDRYRTRARSTSASTSSPARHASARAASSGDATASAACTWRSAAYARSRAEFDGVAYWLVVEALAEGKKVAESRIPVTRDAIADKGPSAQFFRRCTPVPSAADVVVAAWGRAAPGGRPPPKTKCTCPWASGTKGMKIPIARSSTL